MIHFRKTAYLNYFDSVDSKGDGTLLNIVYIGLNKDKSDDMNLRFIRENISQEKPEFEIARQKVFLDSQVIITLFLFLIGVKIDSADPRRVA